MQLNLNWDNFIIMIAAVAVVACVFGIYFWYQDRREEKKHKKA
jgi:sugar phosphate permease